MRGHIEIQDPALVVQLRDASPWHTAPRYLLHDRDRIVGDDFTRHLQDMGNREVLAAPRSPWQRAYVERAIGTLSRECLDHLIVVNEASPRRTLRLYFDYHHGLSAHLSLEKDSPKPRAAQLPEVGRVVAVPQVGGLHHCYERRAARDQPGVIPHRDRCAAAACAHPANLPAAATEWSPTARCTPEATRYRSPAVLGLPTDPRSVAARVGWSFR